MKTNALRITMFQAVIKPLVVAVIEAQLLQVPLAVPVRLGNKEEIRVALPHAWDNLRPILRLGTLTRPAPHVFSKTALRSSIAISQRMPSHCRAMANTVWMAARRSPGSNALSCSTSGHAGK